MAGLGHVASALALIPGAALFFAAAQARRLPRDPVTTGPVQVGEKEEMRSIGILVSAGGMALIRASVGFLSFQLLFYLRATFGLGARRRRRRWRARIGARQPRRPGDPPQVVRGGDAHRSLALIAVAGLLTALIGGLGSAVVLSFAVNAVGLDRPDGVRVDRPA